MSKRGSTKAKNFSGISWGFGVYDKKTTEQKEQINEQKKNIEEQWQSLCKTFNFNLTDENKIIHDKLKRKFNCNHLTRIKSFQNITCFKNYCQINSFDFTLQNYFDGKFNILDFKKKLPEIYLTSENTTIKP